MPYSNLPIVIVEDSPEDFEAVVRALGAAGAPNPVYRFSYGEDALDFLKQRGPYFRHGAEARPGLVILDLNLPGTDGLKVLELVRADPNLKGTPVIVLSTSANRKEISACYLAGASSYVVKPSEPEEFAATIRRIKEYWLEVVALPEHEPALEVVVPKAGAKASTGGATPPPSHGASANPGPAAP